MPDLNPEKPARLQSGVSLLSSGEMRRDEDSTLNRHYWQESERFRSAAYEEPTKHDKEDLDIFWLKDNVLEESANLPTPGVITSEIIDDLEAALTQFAAIAED